MIDATPITRQDDLPGDRNQNGQAMGAKGIKTRQRLIDATLALLEEKRLRDLRVAEIARRARTSPATFYIYFSDAQDVVLAAIRELPQSTPQVMALAGIDWRAVDARAHAEDLLRVYTDFWQRHARLFQARNLAAEEGDTRFIEARMESIRPLLQRFSEAVAAAQADGRMPGDLDAYATAGALIAMIERIAATVRTYSRGSESDDHGPMMSAAYILATTLGGR